jgi:hypothetical protein
MSQRFKLPAFIFSVEREGIIEEGGQFRRSSVEPVHH